MRRFGYFLILQFFLISTLKAQNPIDHWGAVVLAENNWKYFSGTSEPPGEWINSSFDDEVWNGGPGGFGYGDNDDGTIIGSTSSVYLRIKFTISNLSQIEKAVFLADYDDAYVAYLNGVEIARSGISGNRPAYNQFADSQHEASLYQGLYPVETIFSSTEIEEWFLTGENVLAVQVHNINATSSDLSSNFYLNVGLNVNTTLYQPVPGWFRPPLDFETSNLPVVKIDTEGREIVDEPKINAAMGIIDNGPGNLNHINDPFNDYDGRIGIEIRGSSSQMFPKKQYAVELWTAAGQDTSASILGLPEEEDWILYAPYSDKSLIRNVLTYKLGADMGWYAPRTRLCEFYLNNQYKGVYVLTEKIKRDKNRVDISTLNPHENSGDDLTGGYIVKLDKYDGATEGLGWDSPFYPPNKANNQVVHFQYHYPKEDEITSEQRFYIENYITEFESALKGPYFRDSQGGYRDFIHIESFIDFAIINELSRNVDGYRLSTFLYKDKNSKDDKLYIGPIWDFNLAFGNADYCEGGSTTGWAWDFNNICNGDFWLIPFWWKRFLRDPEYVIQFQNRWTELRNGLYSNETIMNYIDSLVSVLDEPQQRNFNKWPILSEYIWPNNYVGNTYSNEVTYLKSWISDRLSWLDFNIAGLEVITDLEDDLTVRYAISIYPNPNNGKFHIHFNHNIESDLDFSLHDNLGKIIFHRKLTFNEINDHFINSGQLSAGIYFVKISDNLKLIHAGKIVIN